MPSRRRYGLVELSVALSAAVISLVSLFIAQRQTRLMNRQLAASVWPVVGYASSNRSETGERRITLNARNDGVGPAAS